MIKKIHEKDIAECVNVIKESFLTVADELGYTVDNAPRFTAFATTEDRLLYQLKNGHRPMFAYYDDGKIIGYYSLALQDNNECELNNLCVLPQYRHKHIGVKLLEDAYIRAKEMGCKKMNIGIVEENTILRKWYEDNGFIHIGTKKFDFSHLLVDIWKEICELFFNSGMEKCFFFIDYIDMVLVHHPVSNNTLQC